MTAPRDPRVANGWSTGGAVGAGSGPAQIIEGDTNNFVINETLRPVETAMAVTQRLRTTKWQKAV